MPNLYRKLVLINTCLRLLAGPIIFFSAGLATLTTFLLDYFDGEIVKRAGYTRNFYNLYDKLLDYYWYVFIIIYLIKV